MIEIEAKNTSLCDAVGTDSCGNTTVAILNINGIKIPLCEICIKELSESLKKFNDTIFCYMCKNFIMSRSGWSYGGSCMKDGKVEIEDAGYVSFVSCMDTCNDAIER